MSKLYPVKDKAGMFVTPELEMEFDVVAELDRVQQILRREIKNLLIASASGKLLPAHSRDLVAYVRLLSDLKKEQEADLANSTDDELKVFKD